MDARKKPREGEKPCTQKQKLHTTPSTGRLHIEAHDEHVKTGMKHEHQDEHTSAKIHTETASEALIANHRSQGSHEVHAHKAVRFEGHELSQGMLLPWMGVPMWIRSSRRSTTSESPCQDVPPGGPSTPSAADRHVFAVGLEDLGVGSLCVLHHLEQAEEEATQTSTMPVGMAIIMCLRWLRNVSGTGGRMERVMCLRPTQRNAESFPRHACLSPWACCDRWRQNVN